MNDTKDASCQTDESALRAIAHDLRHHFHVFDVGLKLLERAECAAQQRSETIQLLKHESVQARATLNALLAAAGVQTGTQTAVPARCEPMMPPPTDCRDL